MTEQDPMLRAEKVARVKAAAADMRRKEAAADRAELELRAARERMERQAAAEGDDEKKGRGRPKGSGCKFTKAGVERVLELWLAPMPLEDAAAQGMGVSKAAIIKWAHERDDFRDQYAGARALRAEGRVDELDKKLADIGDIVKRALRREIDPALAKIALDAKKVEIDTLKWQISKEMPKEYGERQSVELTGPGGKDLFPRMTDEERAASRARTAERRERVMRQLDDEIQEG